MIKIVPAILAKDISTFEEDLIKVDGFAPKVQIDIVDGKFAPMETVMPDVLLTVDTVVEVEAHLVVEEPIDWIDRCVAAGVTTVYGQVEKMTDKMAFIAKAEETGMRTGLAFDVDTPLTGLDEWVNLVDGILLLSVKAGAQGQTFNDSVLGKIAAVSELSASVTIVVDGGLNGENIKKCLEVGGEKIEFAVGSEILRAENPEEKYHELESIDNN